MLTIASVTRSAGSLSRVALLKHCLARASAPAVAGLNALTHVELDVEAMRRAAEESEVRWAAGTPRGPLDGIPVTVKDNFCVEGIPTRAGSRMLASPPFVPPYTATTVERLQAAGAIIIGRSNMDEFGMGSATAFSVDGATRNPYGDGLTAGGSSGGGAAAVASGVGLLALGSDTGGSVRQPAAFCGVVGFKPSYGRLSRHGLISYASSLDCPGIMARTVGDAWTAIAAMAGPDPKDVTSLPDPCPPLPTGDGLQGITVGVPTEYHVAELPPASVAWWERGMEFLEAAGATVRPVSLPHTRHALQAYYVVAPAEAASNLARYDGIRYGHRADFEADADAGNAGAKALHDSITASRTAGFGAEVRRRLLVGNYVLSQGAKSAYYDSAVAVRQAVAADFAAVFDAGVDCLLTPTTPMPPWPVADTASVDAVSMYANDVMTVPASLAGLPAVSIPVGLQGGVPVGLQVIGRQGDEGGVARVGLALEQAAGFEPPAAVHGGMPEVLE